METETPDKIIERYRNAKRLADGTDSVGEANAAHKLCAKLEGKYPHLAADAERQEQYEQLRKVVQDATGLDPFGGANGWGDAVDAANGEKAPEGTRAWNRLAWKALGWATRNLQAAFDAQEDERMSQPQTNAAPEPEAPPTPEPEPEPEVSPAELLKESLLNEEIVVEIGEDEDTGEDLIAVEAIMPLALWTQLTELGPEGAAVLVNLVQDLVDTAE